jgi:hypothetical protein
VRYLDKYAITGVELARDTICPDIGSAMAAVAMLDLSKKWSTKTKLVSSNGSGPSGRLWGEHTFYTGNPHRFQIAAYSCTSKLIDEPCLHEELRLHTAAEVTKKLGWVQLDDIDHQQLGPLFEQIYNQHTEHGVAVDWDKLAKALGDTGLGAGLILSGAVSANCADDKQPPYTAATYDEFKQWLAGHKKRIRAKQKQPGSLSKYDKTLLALRPNRFKIAQEHSNNMTLSQNTN